MTEEEFEKAWERVKAHDAKMKAEWDALPEEEKKRREEALKKQYGAGFLYRISSPVNDDCVDPYDGNEDFFDGN
ncbi:MAG: hypothetical protein J1F29_02595 [Lentimicrobiaceae bacterium]|nr:hypothetical protein [Lentimicrobiaceae bacterium]